MMPTRVVFHTPLPPFAAAAREATADGGRDGKCPLLRAEGPTLFILLVVMDFSWFTLR